MSTAELIQAAHAEGVTAMLLFVVAVALAGAFVGLVANRRGKK